MKHKHDFLFAPIAKQRPRMHRGRAFTPQRTQDFEARVAAEWPKDKTVMNNPCRVVIHLVAKSFTVEVIELEGDLPKMRGDIDNYVKSILDGLNGVAFADDKQVLELEVHKR